MEFWEKLKTAWSRLLSTEPKLVKPRIATRLPSREHVSEDSLQKQQAALRKTGRVIRVLLMIARFFLLLFLLAAVAMMVACLFIADDLAETLALWGVSSTFSSIGRVVHLPFMEVVAPHFRMMIEFFLLAVSLAIMRRLLKFLMNIFYDITEDGRPFEPKTVKKLRQLALWVLLFAFWNVPLAITISALALLMSQVFSYGVYLQDKADENARIQEDVILSFAEITEAKSGQTGQHVRRVSEYARILAEGLGLPAREVEILRIAAMMHDVGKLIVPVEILEKPARLTDEEFAIIKTHTSYGEELLKETTGDILETAEIVAAEHHEKWDGTGYHRGLAGEQIALPARIVAVADVYDALTSRRSYKEAWNPREAYDEIVRCSGTQFDPAVVDAFVQSYDAIEAVRQHYADG